MLKSTIHTDLASLAQAHPTAILSWTWIQPKAKGRLNIPYVKLVVDTVLGPSRTFDESHVFSMDAARSVAEKVGHGLVEAGFHNVLIVPPVR